MSGAATAQRQRLPRCFQCHPRSNLEAQQASDTTEQMSFFGKVFSYVLNGLVVESLAKRCASGDDVIMMLAALSVHGVQNALVRTWHVARAHLGESAHAGSAQLATMILLVASPCQTGMAAPRMLYVCACSLFVVLQRHRRSMFTSCRVARTCDTR